MAVPVFAGEGGLGAFFAAYVILLRRELGFPLLLGFDNLLSHNYLPFRSNEFLIRPPSNQCRRPVNASVPALLRLLRGIPRAPLHLPGSETAARRIPRNTPEESDL